MCISILIKRLPSGGHGWISPIAYFNEEPFTMTVKELYLHMPV